MHRRTLLTAVASAIGLLPAISARAAGAIRAPIFMYHHIGMRGGRYSTTPSAFRAQMQMLAARGCSSVSIDAIADAVRTGTPLLPNSVAITFDDGWRSQFTAALPILNEFGFRATFYIVASYVVPGEQLMNWPDLEKLVKSGQWLGSHSGRHLDQTKLDAGVLANDMGAARDGLMRRLGVAATTHAYPYGKVNARVETAARTAGFRAALGVEARSMQYPSHLFRLFRIEARGGMSNGALARAADLVALGDLRGPR